MDAAGAFILVIWGATMGGGFAIETQEMASIEACRLAQVQLEPITLFNTVCIAADVLPEDAR